MDNIPPHYITNAPKYNKQTCCNIDNGICGIAAQAIWRNDIDSCIAKSWHRCEHRYPDSLKPKLRNKNKHVCNCTHDFNSQSSESDFFYEKHQTGKRVEIKSVLNKQSVKQSDFAAQRNQKYADNSYDPKTADLYESKNHNMPEQAPRFACYNGYKSGYAGSCGGCEECVYVGDAPAARWAYGELQKQTPCQNKQQKTQQDYLSCGKTEEPFFHWFSFLNTAHGRFFVD